MNRQSTFQIRHLLLLLAVLMTFSCARNPVTGKRQLSLMSTKGEVALGAQSDPSIVAQYGLYEDTKIQRFINEKGQKMAAISHRNKLNYEFKILDSPVVNAFAVPGGYVYFTRGIMAHFNNEAEFAGVLGHEIGHITARHSANQYSKAQIAQVGFIVGVIASEKFRQFANEAQTGLSLMFLKFGRDDESQSDQLGVEYSTKIGYDAHYMANFFGTLSRMRDQAGEAAQIPTFLSTHPDPADRFNKVHQLADKAQEGMDKSRLKVNREQYLRMIDGLVYGDDPKQGYVENDYFYHPELKFQFALPRRWKSANSASQFQVAEPNGKAAILLQLAAEKSIAVLADQENPNDPNASLRILTYFIQYNRLIYKLHGLTQKAEYQKYESYFLDTMESFRELKDQSKINVKPERIKIVTAKKDTTLKGVFTDNKVPTDRQEEFSILNSMKLTDRVKKGMMLKIVEK